MRFLVVSIAMLLPSSAALAHDRHLHANACADCLPRYVDAVEWTGSFTAPEEIAPEAEFGPTSSRKQDLLVSAPRLNPPRLRGR
jgi:hypothetical protein